MQYYFHKIIKEKHFEGVIQSIESELKKEGFGIITQIDVKATLKEKIDVDFKKYKILGACNPQFAYKALQNEERIGVFLPCNVIVIEQDDLSIEIAAVDPIASMQSIKNKRLRSIAGEVQNKLKKVIENLN